MLANIVEKWCLRGWYKNQKIPDLCGGAEQLLLVIEMNVLRPGLAVLQADRIWLVFQYNRPRLL
ncbi:hypothetical protein [Endozoicomonas sp. SCSIO W0465]|uniref:hypothetical protein n=1 Tax=Endozoicomonas sp. SCSIO W0465 TaxID=2918516 RepID=UPI0020758B3D|nr:hypothetical protein [Endozoicomonas sp. SCSIO W0465]USE34975.1 hypothetical protein MJO57_23065 [Endozoicomonas sp. SCSIO W0465]